MSEEIKRMLDDIKHGIDTGKSRLGVKVGGICYEWQDLKILFDYITKLQQQNKVYKSHYVKRINMCIDLRNKCNSYQLIIYKAIEYINKLKTYPYLEKYYVLDLINILQGSDSK